MANELEAERDFINWMAIVVPFWLENSSSVFNYTLAHPVQYYCDVPSFETQSGVLH